MLLGAFGWLPEAVRVCLDEEACEELRFRFTELDAWGWYGRGLNDSLAGVNKGKVDREEVGLYPDEEAEEEADEEEEEVDEEEVEAVELSFEPDIFQRTIEYWMVNTEPQRERGTHNRQSRWERQGRGYPKTKKKKEKNKDD